MKISDSSLDAAIARYLTVRRALGREYSNEARVLTSLSKFVRERYLDDLLQTDFDAWCDSFANLNASQTYLKFFECGAAAVSADSLHR